nr:MAG TPA: hypothetical protein [Caudoviricetes sp.]
MKTEQRRLRTKLQDLSPAILLSRLYFSLNLLKGETLC